MTQQLIQRLFVAALGNPLLASEHDSAVLPKLSGSPVITTDSYVVNPLFFPGGDIGSLAVNGTVNDLVMAGARPMYLTLGCIIEEGLLIEDLWRVVCSIASAAREAGVQVVTGDTKVVERGKGDGLFLNTSGIGVVEDGVTIHPDQISAGDSVVISGDPGRHGIAILAQREGLEFETTVESDCTALLRPVHALLEAGVTVRCLRDITRGGLATVCVELGEQSGHTFLIDEEMVPLSKEVRSASELLGLNPFHIASEGRFLAVLDSADAEWAVKVLHQFEVCRNATVIGCVEKRRVAQALLRTAFGGERILEMLSGEQLPRIC
jgi:hydrogenase expression/formation protein HypE